MLIRPPICGRWADLEYCKIIGNGNFKQSIEFGYSTLGNFQVDQIFEQGCGWRLSEIDNRHTTCMPSPRCDESTFSGQFEVIAYAPEIHAIPVESQNRKAPSTLLRRGAVEPSKRGGSESLYLIKTRPSKCLKPTRQYLGSRQSILHQSESGIPQPHAHQAQCAT